MRVHGDDAKNYKVVRLDSMEDVNRGELLEADDDTGFVSWKDKTGESKQVTLGTGATKIFRKNNYRASD